MVERRIDAELRLDNRRRVLVAGVAGLAKSAKEAMSLDPLGRRPRIPGASIGRRPVKPTGVRSIYAKIIWLLL
jgi:hypothetical protein